MVEESFFIKMEAIMMDNGRIIRCMDGENYFMKVENQPIKETGLMTNFMVMEKYIMIIHFLFVQLLDLIIPILIYLMIIGNITKVCWLQIQNKVEEEYN